MVAKEEAPSDAKDMQRKARRAGGLPESDQATPRPCCGSTEDRKAENGPMAQEFSGKRMGPP